MPIKHGDSYEPDALFQAVSTHLLRRMPYNRFSYVVLLPQLSTEKYWLSSDGTERAAASW